MPPVFVHLASRWHLDLSVALGLAAIGGLWWHYRWSASPAHWRALAGFVAVTVLALESPIDYVSDRTLFSVHMVQHLMLLLGAAPLLVLAIPAALHQQMARLVPETAVRVALHPATVLTILTADVWAWHIPALYNAALLSEPLHALEHLTFVGASLPFWAIVLDPWGDSRLSAPGRMFYLFLSSLPNLLLGIIFSFSAEPFYAYGRAGMLPGFDRALAASLGLTPLADQRLGGLLMWVGGSFIYLVILTGILIRWLTSLEGDEEGRMLPEPAPAAGKGSFS